MISSAGLIKYNDTNTDYLFGLYTENLKNYDLCALITLSNVGIYRRIFESNLAKKYVVFDENFLAIKKLCKQYNNVEFVEINNENIIDKIEGKNMKFDLVIGNPPYEGKGNPLYLRILEKVNTRKNIVIWICPSQWTINIEDSEYITNLKQNQCSNLNSHEYEGNPFNNASLGNDVCKYRFDDSNNYEDYEDIRNEKHTNKEIALSIIEKFKKMDNLNKHSYSNTKVAKFDKFCVNAGYVRGHFVDTGKYKWDWTTLFSSEYRNNFNFVHIVNGHHWYFDTEEECKNFVSACETDIISYGMLVSKITTNNTGIVLKYMPWLGDYKKHWTEDEIATAINLTQEEVDYIHQEMKNYGWKNKGTK